MKVAALYDIHGNLPALEAVLDEAIKRKVDLVVAGGDVVLGPMSGECLEKLANLPIPVRYIIGNCEAAVLDTLNGRQPGPIPNPVLIDIKWTAGQLSSDHHRMLKTWPQSFSWEINQIGEILFCHATPESIEKNFTKLTPEAKLMEIFKKVKEPIVVCGHTHMQFDITVGNKRIINAGSVGMPFGKPGAYWLLLEDHIEFLCTHYDLEVATDRILESGYPGAQNFIDKYLLHPPSEEEMLGILTG